MQFLVRWNGCLVGLATHFTKAMSQSLSSDVHFDDVIDLTPFLSKFLEQVVNDSLSLLLNTLVLTSISSSPNIAGKPSVSLPLESFLCNFLGESSNVPASTLHELFSPLTTVFSFVLLFFLVEFWAGFDPTMLSPWSSMSMITDK